MIVAFSRSRSLIANLRGRSQLRAVPAPLQLVEDAWRQLHVFLFFGVRCFDLSMIRSATLLRNP